MRAEGSAVSIAKLCRWFGVARSSFYYRPERSPSPPVIDAEVCEQIRAAIEENPTHGVRMITAVVRKKAERPVNRKKVHRIIKLNGWQVWRKPQGKRPRVKGWTSRASRPNERWAVDATHVFCGHDGWCHLTAIIDCWDRTIVGWRLSKSGVAKIAAAALEEALRSRGVPLGGGGPTLRSDNGLVFGAGAFLKVVRRYGLEQEYITPYTPEQNGMIERFFGTLKAECVWQHRFRDRDDAFAVIARWMDHYHTERPHSALGYLTPAEYREELAA
jgi:putative transposase